MATFWSKLGVAKLGDRLTRLTRLRVLRLRGMRMRRRDALLWIAAGVLAAVGTPYVAHLHPDRAPAQIAALPGALVDASARAIAAVAEGESYLGFDTSHYPGDDAMAAWKSGSPYEWVGYYLSAPCHRDASWSGKRETLEAQGWGMAVVYVGQQTWGKVPGAPVTVTRYVKRKVTETVRRHGKRVKQTVTKTVPVKVVEQPRVLPGQSCDAQLVSGARGAAEGMEAVQRTAAEGFPNGTVIFLDVERMESVPQRMRDYYKAWVAQVLADGRFRPGIYTHTHNAAVVYDDVKAVYVAAGRTGEPPFWVAGGSDFSPEKLPSEVGHLFANVWQGVLDKVETRNGVQLPIDVNVASVPSPSSHRYALGD